MGLWRRLLRDRTAVVCLVVLGLVVVASAAAPLLTSADPSSADIADTLAPISAKHPLGGDGVGRDVLARLLYGGRTSLLGTLLATAVALTVGVPTGLTAGYLAGWFDSVASWLVNLVMALPAIIILLVVLAVAGPNTYLAMAIFGVLLAPGVFHLVRASTSAVRTEAYVDAARVAGLSDARIIRRHILPVVQAPTIIQAAYMLGVGIALQAGLEFLGLGSPTQPSWGAMLNDAFTRIYDRPALILWPGVALAVTTAAFAMLGNALRDALDPSRATLTGRRATGGPATGDGRAGDGATGGESGAVATATRAPAPEPEGGRLLVVRDLRVAYPAPAGTSTVVDGVTLSVRRGEVLGLVGESGSGKTQTAFAVLGLLPTTAIVTATGIHFDGTDLRALDERHLNDLRGRRIAYVPQEPMSNLDPSFRVGSQLAEPLRRHLGLSRRAATRTALDLLDRVGIVDPRRVLDAYPHQISGGMAQRVLIAGAVSCNPDLLIADEPTTALDVTIQAEVLDLIRSLQKERNMGVVLVTHNFGVVADICDTVAVMHQGRIVETAAATELFASPRHLYTRSLLGSTLENAPPRGPYPAAAAVDGSAP
ncbi:ABC transporter [Pseudofrankia sp. BMG5.36]|nr:ABC transporter [Pseudofrankia sp. BMG5.36]